MTGTEPTARPEDDALDSLDAVIVQYERAMHELGWTMVNVRARDAVATVREALERLRSVKAIAQIKELLERAESAEAEARRLTEGLRDLIKEAPEALDQNAVWVDDLLDLLSASPSDGGWGMKRARWHLALAAQALRNAPCERTAFLWQRDCKDRDDLPRGQWCLRCRELVRLEAMGFVQPERPSDREFREAMERGEAFEVVDGGGAK